MTSNQGVHPAQPLKPGDISADRGGAVRGAWARAAQASARPSRSSPPSTSSRCGTATAPSSAACPSPPSWRSLTFRGLLSGEEDHHVPGTGRRRPADPRTGARGPGHRRLDSEHEAALSALADEMESLAAQGMDFLDVDRILPREAAGTPRQRSYPPTDRGVLAGTGHRRPHTAYSAGGPVDHRQRHRAIVRRGRSRQRGGPTGCHRRALRTHPSEHRRVVQADSPRSPPTDSGRGPATHAMSSRAWVVMTARGDHWSCR